MIMTAKTFTHPPPIPYVRRPFTGANLTQFAPIMVNYSEMPLEARIICALLREERALGRAAEGH